MISAGPNDQINAKHAQLTGPIIGICPPGQSCPTAWALLEKMES